MKKVTTKENPKENTPVVTTEKVSAPQDDTNQVFHKGKEDSPQIEELKKMIQNMTQNVNLLMQERMYWNWGQQQYYQQQ